jgi:hypothetical protein
VSGGGLSRLAGEQQRNPTAPTCIFVEAVFFLPYASFITSNVSTKGNATRKKNYTCIHARQACTY